MTQGATPISSHVTLQPSGLGFDVQGDETILQAAIREGMDVPYSCQHGFCGVCKCRKLSGEVVMAEHSEFALSPEEEAQGMILVCCARPQGDVALDMPEVGNERPLPVVELAARVQSLELLAPDVMCIRLQLPQTGNFEYRPGQYLEFVLPDGRRRAYSMATAPHICAQQQVLELHVRKMEDGLFTTRVFSQMKAQDLLRAEGPLGSFWLRDDSEKPVIMLASGTGFAPVKAMLEHLAHEGNTRAVSVYWGARRPHDLYMHDWMTSLAQQMPWLKYTPVVSDAVRSDNWSGRTGLVHRAVLEDVDKLSGWQVYACGTPLMVQAARKSFVAEADLPEDSFFADAFTPADGVGEKK